MSKFKTEGVGNGILDNTLKEVIITLTPQSQRKIGELVDPRTSCNDKALEVCCVGSCLDETNHIPRIFHQDATRRYQ